VTPPELFGFAARSKLPANRHHSLAASMPASLAKGTHCAAV